MSDRFARTTTTLGLVLTTAGLLATSQAALAQTAERAGTLVIAGQQEQAPLVRMRGKSYIDVESLARVLHASVRFQGAQTILTLPGALPAAATAAAPAVKPPQLSAGYLSAAIEAVAGIREWRVALVNAVQNSVPVTDSAMSPLRRAADSKLQLAIAAATTEPDQQAAALLRNDFAAMLHMSDQYIAAHTAATYVAPDSAASDPQEQKIAGCEQALTAMASTKQFQDAPACH